MMNNEVISLEEKIMLLINGKMDQNSYDECQSTQLSKELKLGRNQVIRLLNELFNEKKLIKIKASPILYLSRASLESKYKKKLSSDEYKSLDELEAELNNQTELQNFEKLIGSNESMYQIVEKIKATVAYPPVGLPMLFYGPTGTGKSFMAKLTYEYCVDTGLIDASKNFVQVNCSEYANNPELQVRVTSHSRKKSKKRGIEDLPETVVEHDLEDKTDPQTGKPLRLIGTNERKELVHHKEYYEVIKHIQYVYSGEYDEEIETTPMYKGDMPKAVIPKSFASPSLLASILDKKYNLSLPLYR